MSSTHAKIALFGVTGNVGKEVVAALKEQLADTDDSSFHFLLFTRDVSNATAGKDDRFELLALPQKHSSEEDGKSTELDTAALAVSLDGVETCFICVPQSIVPKCKEYVEEFLPAWKEAGIKRVVKVGTGNAGEYEYGRRHQEAEETIRKADPPIELTVVEGGDYCTNHHWLGPGPPGAPYMLIDVFKGLSYFGGMFRSMGNVGSFVGPTVKVPFLDLRDFGHALATVLLDAPKHEGKTYRIHSDTVSMTEVASVYSDLLNRTISVLDMSDEEIRAILAMEKYPAEVIDLGIDMFQKFRQGYFEADDSWDGLAKLCPNRKPGTFRTFAEDKVNSRWKPISLW